jgi:hypothetical protein
LFDCKVEAEAEVEDVDKVEDEVEDEVEVDTGQMMTNRGPIRWKSDHLISTLLVPYFF